MNLTAEDLYLMSRIASYFISDQEGVTDDSEIQEVQALRNKINQMRLVGREVRFLFEGEELIGTLDRYENRIDGATRAMIVWGGFMHSVAPKALRGEA